MNGLSRMSAWSLFVGARMSQRIGATKKIGEQHEDHERQAEAEDAGRHQSSVLKRPLRVTMMTAPMSPIASRSTAIAAAPLKSA